MRQDSLDVIHMYTKFHDDWCRFQRSARSAVVVDVAKVALARRRRLVMNNESRTPQWGRLDFCGIKLSRLGVRRCHP